MGWKEGIGTLAIMVMALPVIFVITNSIPGLLDDGIAIFTMLSWVVGSFTGRSVDVGITKQIHDTLELRQYQDALDKGLDKLEAFNLVKKGSAKVLKKDLRPSS